MSSTLRDQFMDWVRATCEPLRITDSADGIPMRRLDEWIADARIVALGEGDHFAAEPLLLRNAIVRHLVERKGFTVVALESGLVEGRVVHDFVNGFSSQSLPEVLSQGISWTFDQLEQNQSLITWLRDHNRRLRSGRPVRFYGFDVPGSPGNPRAKRGLGTAIAAALEYLSNADAPAADGISKTLEQYLPDLFFDRLCTEAGYARYDRADRDAISGAVADVRKLLDRNAERYVAATGAEEFEWAMQAAIGAVQVDRWLRTIPLGWCSSNEQLRFADQASDVRDQCQADNLDWIIRREGADAKVIIFAHNCHVSNAPVEWHWWLRKADGSLANECSGRHSHRTAGGILRRAYGSKLVTIGTLLGPGNVGASGYPESAIEPLPGSLDSLAGEVMDHSFALNLRTAPEELRHWLQQPRFLGPGIDIVNRYKVLLKTSVVQAFDAVVYLHRTTPAGAKSPPPPLR